MSFNIRFARLGHSEEKQENNWANEETPRRERVIRVIEDYVPDILGVQEARHHQIADLQKALPDYEFYGQGRDDGKTGGEYVGIFYRKDRLERVDDGSFWLSALPEKPGTTFSELPNPVPRMVSWLRLRDKPSKREFVVLNTHWDHISKFARRKSAELIKKRLRAIRGGMPAIVMGDFNGPENTKEVRTLVAGDEALVDSYRSLNPTAGKEEGTFGGWKGDKAGNRIDFILHTPDIKPIAAAIDRTSYSGFWPSDHYPVTATLQLGESE